MSAAQKKLDRVLVIQCEKDDSYGSKYGHIRGFISHANERPEGWKDDSYGPDSEVCNVRINSQCGGSSDASERGMYAWELGYRAHMAVTVHEAQKALKALAPIERRLDKMRDAEGSAVSFGAWINRIARASNCIAVFTFSEEAKQFSGTGWRRHSVGDSVYVLDRMAVELSTWAAGLKAAA